MSFSCIVPWANVSEWQKVQQGLLSDGLVSLVNAYETMLMWKCRVKSVPAFVECTCGLLQVMLEEQSRSGANEDMVNGDHDLRLLYSTCLIRFVNHVSSVNPSKGDSLYLAAKSQNILDWIVNLRHDAAHGVDLPPLDALQAAAQLSLQWLIDHYWTTEEALMTENILETIPVSKSSSDQILDTAVTLLKACFDSQKTDGRYLADMPETSCSLLATLVQLCITDCQTRKKKSKVTFQQLRATQERWQEWIQSQDTQRPQSRKVTAEITELRQLLLLVMEMTHNKDSSTAPLVAYLLDSNFVAEETDLSEWLDILQVVLKLGALPFLINQLFRLICDENKKNTNVMARQWLLMLHPAIRSLKNKWNIYQELLQDQELRLTKKVLRDQARAIDTNRYRYLVFDLGICKPPVITLDILRQALLQPDTCPRKLVLSYLKLVEPPLPATTKARIKQLVRIYQGKRVYDVQDGEEEEQANDTKVFSLADVDVLTQTTPEDQHEEIDNTWTKSGISSDTWQSCPIGLLPHQNAVNCNVPPEITWTLAGGCKRPRSVLETHIDNVKMMKRQ